MLNKEVKKKCNEAKKKWINEKCQEIEQNQHLDSKYMHSKIKEVSGKKSCPSTNCIKSKDNRGERPAIKKNTDGPPILKAEVEAAIRKMKRGKATGSDGIPIEKILALEEMGIGMTTKLLHTIYDSRTIPEDLAKSVFIALPKIPGATECELHRTISLMSHITKVLLRVLMLRMRKSLRPEIAKTQFLIWFCP